MIADADLLALTAGRWLAPLMALLDEEGGARFAAMLGRLGLSRSALAASLAQLQAAGWVMRNPGHGHPLRPEYVLSDKGLPIAAFARRLMAEREKLGLERGRLSRWSLPIVSRLGEDKARFSQLRASLRPVTPRALSLSLKQLLEVRLIDRALEDEFPPIAIYGLTGRGRDLAAVLR
jgi:DNA-binding HxlR family transcriptional regulator